MKRMPKAKQVKKVASPKATKPKSKRTTSAKKPKGGRSQPSAKPAKKRVKVKPVKAVKARSSEKKTKVKAGVSAKAEPSKKGFRASTKRAAAKAPKKLLEQARKVQAASSSKRLSKRSLKPGEQALFDPDSAAWVKVRLAAPYLDPSERATPGSLQERGRNKVRGRLRVDNPRGRRATLEAIRGWIAKRKHVQFWRNRDGSYSALVTFRGEACQEQMARALRKMPVQGCYVGVTTWEVATPSQALEGNSKGELLTLKTGERKVLIPSRSPTVSAEKDPTLAFLKSFIYTGSPTQYDRAIGLAILWNGK